MSKKLSVIRFKPKPEHYDQFLSDVLENGKDREPNTHLTVLATVSYPQVVGLYRACSYGLKAYARASHLLGRGHRHIQTSRWQRTKSWLTVTAICEVDVTLA